MANKPKFTQAQAQAFEQFTKIREGFALQAFMQSTDVGEFTGQYEPLNDIGPDEFARALYGGGYELDEEETYWAALGREVAEFHHGDIFLDKHGIEVNGTPDDARRLYVQGNFSGLYPADSFRPFGKDVR